MITTIPVAFAFTSSPFAQAKKPHEVFEILMHILWNEHTVCVHVSYVQTNPTIGNMLMC